jgi:hypothetical protein
MAKMAYAVVVVEESSAEYGITIIFNEALLIG